MNATAPTAKPAALDPQALFTEAFRSPRSPRSEEYKAAVLALLRVKCGKAVDCPCPYEVGTASADAWFSGIAEGHSIFRRATQPA